MKRGMRDEPAVGKWDYDGEWIPKPGSMWRTFSVGIFQWVSVVESQCKRDLPSFLKRGKVVCRVRGLTSEPEMVYELAEKICAHLSAGLFPPVRQSYTAERRERIAHRLAEDCSYPHGVGREQRITARLLAAEKATEES